MFALYNMAVIERYDYNVRIMHDNRDRMVYFGLLLQAKKGLYHRELLLIKSHATL